MQGYFELIEVGTPGNLGTGVGTIKLFPLCQDTSAKIPISLTLKAASLALCCPITSNIKGYPFEVLSNGNKVKGAILSDHLKSLDWRARKVKFAEKAKPAVLKECIGKISTLIFD